MDSKYVYILYTYFPYSMYNYVSFASFTIAISIATNSVHVIKFPTIVLFYVMR